MAKGERQPSSVTGRLKSSSTERKEPSIKAISSCSTAPAARSSTGLATIGTKPEVNPPQATRR